MGEWRGTELFGKVLRSNGRALSAKNVLQKGIQIAEEVFFSLRWVSFIVLSTLNKIMLPLIMLMLNRTLSSSSSMLVRSTWVRFSAACAAV